jgi:hypothetical protein
VLSVLSKLTIAIAVVCGPPLAGVCSAQMRRYVLPGTRPVSYQEPVEEAVPPGTTDERGGEQSDGAWQDGYSNDEYFDAPDDGAASFFSVGDWLNERADALIPDGMWHNRGPNWYTSASVALLRQNKAGQQSDALAVATGLVAVTAQELINGVQQTVVLSISQPTGLTTSGPGFHIVPGLRLTVGRNLFEDILQRQHAIEFQFLGLTQWEGSAYQNGVGESVIQNGSITTIHFPGLYSFFPPNVGGFGSFAGGASNMNIVETSAMNNFEMNYRISKLPRSDRIAHLPDGTWMQVGTPTLVHSVLGGIRVFTYNDTFNWNSTGTYNGSGLNFSPINGPFSGVYNVKTTNTLVGTQIGGDLFMHYNVWTLGIRSKAGVYYNGAKQISDVQINDPIFGNSAGHARGEVGRVAFLGDLGFVGTGRMTERSYFRFSYDFLWAAGLANAPEQLQYTTNLAPSVRSNGKRLFQGCSIGFDFCW